MNYFIIFVLIFVNVYANLSVIPLQSRRNSRIHETCGKNEIFMECGKNCQTECPTLGQPCFLRQFKCPSGCYCIEGYAREIKHGRCIPISKCPNNYGFGYNNRDHQYSSQQDRNSHKELPSYQNTENNIWPYQQISLGEHSHYSYKNNMDH